MSQISNDTLTFLKELKENNNKLWFDENKASYESARLEVSLFAERVIELVNEFDVIETPSGKKALYRIYRDIRFSKDKSPYKNYFGGYLRRAGAQRRGGLVFHIEPNGKTMLGGGFWDQTKKTCYL